MKEKKRDQQEKHAGGNGDDGLFGITPSAVNNLVSISCGPYVEDLPVAGSSVAEVRQKFSDRFDIDDESTAIVNGIEVDNNYLIKAGDQLSFIRRAGEKGAATIKMLSNIASAELDGTVGLIQIDKLVSRISSGANSGPAILPTGVKAVLSQGCVTLWFWEQPPRVCQFSWIASNSPRPYGPGTVYRNVRIALPYLIIMAVFTVDQKGYPSLALQDECFFRSEPLRSMKDELCYPALLNCSVMGANSAPLAWICTQYLKSTSKMRSKDIADRYTYGFEAVRYCLLETAFNLSSEHHEGNSWYGQSKAVDPRIATIEAWEQNTENYPMFVSSVPWIKTGHSVASMAQRTFSRLGQHSTTINTADDVARLIFNG